MRPRAEIIARITACLQLADPSKNTNEHERKTARRLADELIERHGIFPEELTGEEVRPSGDPVSTAAGVFTSQGIRPSGRGWGPLREGTCSECAFRSSEVKWDPRTKTSLCPSCLEDSPGDIKSV